jgi:hypothetical protein
MRRRTFWAAICAAVLVFPQRAMAVDLGTFVGGYATYHLRAGGPRSLAGGVELHLIASAHVQPPKPDFRRLDYDHTAAPGAENEGVFAMGCREQHDVVTILYYPRMPEGGRPPERFLCKVVSTSCAPVDPKSRRGKVRIDLTATKGSLDTSADVFSAVLDAWKARQLAAALDLNVPACDVNFNWHMRMIAAMIPDKDRDLMLVEVSHRIRSSEFKFLETSKSELEAHLVSVLLNKSEIHATREIMARAWQIFPPPQPPTQPDLP